MLASTVTTGSRFEVVDHAPGPMPCVIVATWPSGSVVGAPFGPGDHERQLREVGRALRAPRARAAPSTSRVSPVGIDPVAGVDAGERRAQRLRDLPDA